MCNYPFTHLKHITIHCSYNSPQTNRGSVLSTDKVAILGEEYSQTLQSSAMSHEDEIALLQEQMHEQYFASKCTFHFIVVSCLLVNSLSFS